jgi:hypothetical protein
MGWTASIVNARQVFGLLLQALRLAIRARGFSEKWLATPSICQIAMRGTIPRSWTPGTRHSQNTMFVICAYLSKLTCIEIPQHPRSRQEAVRGADEGRDCGISKASTALHSHDGSDKTSDGFDVNNLPISDDSSKNEAATEREDVNGVQENGQEQESVPAAERSSQQSLPAFQHFPAPVMGSGILSCTQEVDSADTAAGSDDSVRNIMMAWYWAGYYTGLHEGSKKPPSK